MSKTKAELKAEAKLKAEHEAKLKAEQKEKESLEKEKQLAEAKAKSKAEFQVKEKVQKEGYSAKIDGKEIKIAVGQKTIADLTEKQVYELTIAGVIEETEGSMNYLKSIKNEKLISLGNSNSGK